VCVYVYACVWCVCVLREKEWRSHIPRYTPTIYSTNDLLLHCMKSQKVEVQKCGFT